HRHGSRSFHDGRRWRHGDAVPQPSLAGLLHPDLELPDTLGDGAAAGDGGAPSKEPWHLHVAQQPRCTAGRCVPVEVDAVSGVAGEVPDLPNPHLDLLVAAALPTTGSQLLGPGKVAEEAVHDLHLVLDEVRVIIGRQQPMVAVCRCRWPARCRLRMSRRLAGKLQPSL
uniref:Uncharacterized protein n=1 Tax=Triticum urartu TaxID=4572 RepID=A0A8R7QIH0_TRIUA